MIKGDLDYSCGILLNINDKEYKGYYNLSQTTNVLKKFIREN